MKKKLLLFIVPALLALSSCTFMESATVVKGDELLEDCLAHDEIFGRTELDDVVQVQKAKKEFRASDPDFDPEEVTTPYIGVQSFVESGKVSFRFVAAVRFETSDARVETTATWHRSITSSDGTFIKEEGVNAVPECNTAYLALNNNGTSYSIDDFNEDHNDSNYTHFVVYTLRNVSLTTYAGHYVSAYLTLTNSADDGVDATSKAIAINVERNEKYVYTHDAGEYLISGSFGGEAKIVEPSAVRTDSNKAEFEYLDLTAGDTFVIKEFYNTKLYVHGSDECLEYDGNTKIKSCFEDDGDGKIKVKASMGGSYGLYLSKTDNRLYTEEGAPYGVHNGFYIKGGMNGWAAVAAYEMYNDRNNVAVLESVSLTAGQEFKIWKDWGDNERWYGWHDDKVSNDSSLFSWASGDNIHCNTTGVYNIFLNGNYKVWVNPVE